MERKQFIRILMGATAITGLGSLAKMLDEPETGERLPVLFIGHGSPMNALEDNVYTRGWREIAGKIRKPRAILCISAHWLTNGSWITAVENPKTIHDFGGFPDELFRVQYPAKGMPELAKEAQSLMPENLMHLDMEWGLDHGTWSILKQMYPLADVPVLQLSIDYNKPAAYHLDLASKLSKLRDRGVLIIGSGNMIHNLGMVAWDKMNEVSYGYDWAIEINELFKKKLIDRDFASLADWQKLHKDIRLAVPTPDHYYPMMYTLGLANTKDEISLFNDYTMAGSLSMTSVKIG